MFPHSWSSICLGLCDLLVNTMLVHVLFSALWLLFYFTQSVCSSDEYYTETYSSCLTNSEGDTEFIISKYFNKKILARYNSTERKWTGYYPYATQVVATWSVHRQDFEKEIFCTANVGTVHDVIEDNLGEYNSLTKSFSRYHTFALLWQPMSMVYQWLYCRWFPDNCRWMLSIMWPFVNPCKTARQSYATVTVGCWSVQTETMTLHSACPSICLVLA